MLVKSHLKFPVKASLGTPEGVLRPTQFQIAKRVFKRYSGDI